MDRLALPCLVAILAFLPTGASTQEVPQWRNLQVFPPGVPRDELAQAMRENVSGLGLTPVDGTSCANCHVIDDFASDAIPMKVRAREMMALTLRLNRELRTDAGPGGLGDFRVTCATCHQGSLRPPGVPDPMGSQTEAPLPPQRFSG